MRGEAELPHSAPETSWRRGGLQFVGQRAPHPPSGREDVRSPTSRDEWWHLREVPVRVQQSTRSRYVPRGELERSAPPALYRAGRREPCIPGGDRDAAGRCRQERAPVPGLRVRAPQNREEERPLSAACTHCTTGGGHMRNFPERAQRNRKRKREFSPGDSGRSAPRSWPGSPQGGGRQTPSLLRCESDVSRHRARESRPQ